MNIANKTVLITGANRGIGRALVTEALRRGAKRVYAGTRSALQNTDKRVTPLTLDVTSVSEIQRLFIRSFVAETAAWLSLGDDMTETMRQTPFNRLSYTTM